MSAFVMQREVEGIGGRSNWFDAERFDNRGAVLAAVKRARENAQARINMDGGTSYTMRHPQRIRAVEVLS